MPRTTYRDLPVYLGDMHEQQVLGVLCVRGGVSHPLGRVPVWLCDGLLRVSVQALEQHGGGDPGHLGLDGQALPPRELRASPSQTAPAQTLLQESPHKGLSDSLRSLPDRPLQGLLVFLRGAE